MKQTGFYIIKDQFFEDMQDPYLKGNKSGNRPQYYCSKDSSAEIYWMIPLSSKIDKYKRIIDNKENAGNHLMLTSEHSIKEIEHKARKIISMLKRGVKLVKHPKCYNGFSPIGTICKVYPKGVRIFRRLSI